MRARPEAWAEALTELHPSHVTDADCAAVRAQFDETEVAELTMAADR